MPYAVHVCVRVLTRIHECLLKHTYFQAMSKYTLCFLVCLHMACVTKRPLQCDPSDYVTVLLLHPRLLYPYSLPFFLERRTHPMCLKLRTGIGMRQRLNVMKS